MHISERTISAVGRIVTGDEHLSRYRSGPQLVRLFNEYGGNDVYGQGFPSRWQYAEDRIRALNGTASLGAFLCEILDPREFLDTEFQVEKAIEYVNKRPSYEGYQLELINNRVRVVDRAGDIIECPNPFEGSEEDGHTFISEQIEKAERKVQEADYDGAITNARSLVEAVLLELDKALDPNAAEYDGDLTKLYRRVQKLLTLDPGRADVEGPLRQVLSALASIVSGLSGLSNRVGDRHVRTYKPDKHHAVLVVNAARTLVNFLFDTHEYQKRRGSKTNE